MQIKLQRMAISSEAIATPILAASNTPLPSYTSSKLYPKTDRLATSLPGWNPLGTVRNNPVLPSFASLSI